VLVEGRGFSRGIKPLKRRCEAREGFVRKRKSGEKRWKHFFDPWGGEKL